jgi:glycosyltransferase involved in cell wall biosynthesis
VVVDSVDVHYLRESRMAATAGNDPELVTKAEETRKRELAVYRAADRVVCVTEDDAAELRPQLHGVELAIVPCVYDDVPMGPAFAERDTVLFIGSALHNANPDAVEWWADEIGPRLAERLPGVPLTVVGYDPNGTFEALAGPHVRVIGAVPSVLPYLHAARVSVAPLRFGAGMKGKVIEAMMAGLPVVGTTIAMEGIGVEPGVHGEVADDADAFADAVARVYRDAEHWDAMRAAGRELVVANFGMDRMRAALPRAIVPLRSTRRR